MVKCETNETYLNHLLEIKINPIIYVKMITYLENEIQHSDLQSNVCSEGLVTQRNQDMITENVD